MKTYNCSFAKILRRELTVRSLVLPRQILPFIFLVGISLGLFILAENRLNQLPYVDKVPSNTALAQKSLHQISVELEYYSSL